jgi:hypothetical protein
MHSNVQISERLRRLCGTVLRRRVAPPQRSHEGPAKISGRFCALSAMRLDNGAPRNRSLTCAAIDDLSLMDAGRNISKTDAT